MGLNNYEDISITGKKSSVPLPPPVPPEAGCFAFGKPAWEEPGALVAAFLKTTWQMLSHPGLTLSAPAFSGYQTPLAFALPWLIIAAAFSALYAGLFGNYAFNVYSIPQVVIGNLVFMVFFVLFIHLALFIVRGDKNGFQATFRALAYLCATCSWFIVPFVGPFLAAVWWLGAFFPAMAASQQASRLKILAALMVLFVIFLFIALLIAMLIGVAALTHLMAILQENLQI